MARDNVYATGNVTITLSGSEISGSGELDGYTLALEGEIYSNEQYASGTWTSAGENGNFFWEKLPDEQIIGNAGFRKGFCAARAGLPQPDPCYTAPLD